MKSKVMRHNTKTTTIVPKRVTLNDATKRQSIEINAKSILKSVKRDLKVLKKHSFG